MQPFNTANAEAEGDAHKNTVLLLIAIFVEQFWKLKS